MAKLQVRRLGYALGAEVTGVDFTQDLDAEALAGIRSAWFEHIVLCFPGQKLSPEDFRAFCGRFGELDMENSGTRNRHPEHPGVVLLAYKPVITAGGKRAGGGVPARWHTDRSYRDRPSEITFLLAKELPETGGDTMFANAYMAYETLSPAFQKLIGSLAAVHDASLWQSNKGKTTPETLALLAANPPAVHDLVQVHPETGRRALYLGEDRTEHFVGMTAEETKPLVDFINAHITRYEFTYRHRWKVDDLVMWDNRCALHLAVPDYDQSQVRRLLRCSVLGATSGYVYDNAPAETRSA